MPYSSMSQMNSVLKGIKPPITLSQANHIANMADSITDVENSWAVAIANFKREYKVQGNGWVKKDKKELMVGLKTLTIGNENLIVLWTSNAFKDLEKEIFSTKAWQDYVDRRDHTGRKDRVWFWHVKGTDFADVIWQGMVGRILVEVAKVDDTEYGRKMFDALENPDRYPDLLPYGWGTSHGYAYPRFLKRDGVYNFVEKFETTVLPLHRASNWFGGLKEVIRMPKGLTKEKEASLVQLLGEDLATAILSDAEKASDTLEGLVDFKELGITAEQLAEAILEQAEKAKTAKKVEKVSGSESDDEDEEDDDGEIWEMELDDTLIKEIAENVPLPEGIVTKKELDDFAVALKEQIEDSMAKAVKELFESKETSLEEGVKQAIAGTLKLRPYVASNAKDNTSEDLADVLEEREKARKNGKDKTVDSVGSVVNMMLGDR